MRTSIAALFAAILITILATSSVAWSAPTEINVRIEGESETLFEGPIWTEGHDVEASSDTKERTCDGINPNDPENVVPGPTPTAASVDAMSLIGETFDGQWYGGYDDYFITRWGPEQEADGMSWGVLVNNVFTDVGGCQYELSPDDEVLWAYDAFGEGPFLALYPAGDTDGAPPLTATAELGEPFAVEVLDYDEDAEDPPPASPGRTGSSPFAGADVSPVQTSAKKGFEKVDAASPATVKTDADGRAGITFTTTGWHRIKAAAVNAQGKEDAIRSNRLDVCVPVAGETDCGEPPPEDQVRTPPAHQGEHEAPENEREATSPHLEGEQDTSDSAGPQPQTTVTSAATRPLVASGSTGSGAANSAKPSVAKGLRLDGFVLIPQDDRAPSLRYRGHWRRLTDPEAWLDTVTRGTAGSQVTMRLGAGRPVFILRGAPHDAKVEVLDGSRREMFTVAAGTDGSARTIIAANRSHAGTVSLRVLKGTVDLDGVAVAP
jgi:hypothetical protein